MVLVNYNYIKILLETVQTISFRELEFVARVNLLVNGLSTECRAEHRDRAPETARERQTRRGTISLLLNQIGPDDSHDRRCKSHKCCRVHQEPLIRHGSRIKEKKDI